jgi:hypothetical protein
VPNKLPGLKSVNPETGMGLGIFRVFTAAGKEILGL